MFTLYTETIKCLSSFIVHHIIGAPETKGKQHTKVGRGKEMMGETKRRVSVQSRCFVHGLILDPDFTGGGSVALGSSLMCFLTLHFSHRQQ